MDICPYQVSFPSARGWQSWVETTRDIVLPPLPSYTQLTYLIYIYNLVPIGIGVCHLCSAQLGLPYM